MNGTMTPNTQDRIQTRTLVTDYNKNIFNMVELMNLLPLTVTLRWPMVNKSLIRLRERLGSESGHENVNNQHSERAVSHMH